MLRKDKKQTLWEAISSPANFPNYDSGIGRGYGQLAARNHFPRNSASTYPYKVPPESEFDDESTDSNDTDVEDGTYDFQVRFRNKVGSVGPSDTLADRSVDHQYFVGSATPFDMFGEAYGSRSEKTSIVPITNLYKGKQAVIGGAHSWNAVYKPIMHTRGGKEGFSRSIPNIYDDFEEFEKEKDSQDPVSRIRAIVRAYHELNLKR